MSQIMLCVCGRELPISVRLNGKRKYCDACREEKIKHWRRLAMRRRMKPKHCIRCGQPITITRGRRAEVCADCIKTILDAVRSRKTCTYCGKPTAHRSYCGRSCYQKAYHLAEVAGA